MRSSIPKQCVRVCEAAPNNPNYTMPPIMCLFGFLFIYILKGR